ncbi:hypothetical protein ACHAWU_001676 [Discostella pseudostelligera]|uniref:Aldose 1-epimerase n=1 Tax=Discostella pseudostelligera TaxID=259834 RepID=A0ABD3MIW3_9STRA
MTITITADSTGTGRTANCQRLPVSTAMATLVELPPASSNVLDGSVSTIRLFQLTLNDVTVELSSLGASITKVLLPRNITANTSTPGLQRSLERDDVVLSYATQNDQYDDGNKPFFGAIVGRVANRIKDGRFQLLQSSSSSSNKLETYQLEKNNGPNHLHGGSHGFWRKIWNAAIVNNTVQFTLISSDGDQGYPGGIEITAVYTLVHLDGNGDDDGCGAKLCLEMRATLLNGETKATPISLAQHSYFNLASHSSRHRILDHTLHLPNCSIFTPFDDTSIPTRKVQRVGSAGTMSMDFRKEKLIGNALLQYAEESAVQGHVDAIVNVQRFMASEELDMSATVPDTRGPFGFDHNYVIERNLSEQQSLRLAAVLSHPPTGRSLRVLTTAPGMQLYTSNYLDGTTPPPALCKDNSRYCRWQGICLETQTYPDSIISCDDVGDEFSRGRCFILRPGGGEYIHTVQYEFRTMFMCS